MKRFFCTAAFLLSFGLLDAYSVFNTRGLGQYEAPVEYLSIPSRNVTVLEGRFKFEYDRTSEDGFYKDAFLVCPERLYFFFKLPWGFGLSTQITERYNLDFDVESDTVESSEFKLIRKVRSIGGIEGMRVGIDKSFWDIVYIGVGYERLFGGAWERWESRIRQKNIPDTLASDYDEVTIDSLLYYFRGNGVWGIAGVKIGPVEVRGFYGYPLGLNIRTELATLRDTSIVDSLSLLNTGVIHLCLRSAYEIG